jgi:hypothetical protein
MDPRSATTERNMIPAVGPQFFRGEDASVQFQYVIDSGNVIGPRPATRADQEKHAGAWSAFAAAAGVSGLDRDASGGDGGSLPAEPERPAAPVQASAPEAAAKKPRGPYKRRKKG